jgi:hypothetical protein
MRVTISHRRNPEDVKTLVDRSIDDVFASVGGGMVQMVDQQKSWDGDIMTFAMNVKAGFFTAPIKGTVVVTPADVTIDADLGILDKFIAEDRTRTAIEGKVQALLA